MWENQIIQSGTNIACDVTEYNEAFIIINRCVQNFKIVQIKMI